MADIARHLNRLEPILTGRRITHGVIVAVLAFAALGTVSAVWENSFFIRMTPAAGPEIILLALLALSSGLFVTVRRPACASKRAGAAGVLSFLGFACPVCNKILLYLFGGELLMSYFEPVRIYVGIFGIALMVWLIVREYQMWESIAPDWSAETP